MCLASDITWTRNALLCTVSVWIILYSAADATNCVQQSRLNASRSESQRSVDESFPTSFSHCIPFNSAYSSTGNFSIIKSHQILHNSDIQWQVRLTWIRTYLHTRFQIPHDGTLLFGTDEISFATNLAGPWSEQLVRNFHTLSIETEIWFSLNRLKSLSKFIRVCQSLSSFWPTAFTTILFHEFPPENCVFCIVNKENRQIVFV